MAAANEYLNKAGLSELVAKIQLKYATKAEIPTKTSDLTNDSTYQTEAQVTDAIAQAISGITNFSYEIVQTLPAEGVKGIIYLVANAESGSYDEYVWIETTSEFVKIGSQEIDLSEYLKTSKLIGDGANVNVSTDEQTGNTVVTLTAEALASLAKAESALQASDFDVITNAYIDSLFE